MDKLDPNRRAVAAPSEPSTVLPAPLPRSPALVRRTAAVAAVVGLIGCGGSSAQPPQIPPDPPPQVAPEPEPPQVAPSPEGDTPPADPAAAPQ